MRDEQENGGCGDLCGHAHEHGHEAAHKDARHHTMDKDKLTARVPEHAPASDCGCKHDHGYADEAGCSCGRNHHYDHGCEHDHSHDQAHGQIHGQTRDQAHVCGSADAHDHHDHAQGHENSGLSVREHEGALVLQTAWESRGDEAEERKKLADAMLEIGSRVNEAGGLIGHIKACFLGHTGGAMLSMTDDRVNETPFALDTVRCELTVIVYAVGRDELSEIVRGALLTHCQRALP